VSALPAGGNRKDPLNQANRAVRHRLERLSVAALGSRRAEETERPEEEAMPGREELPSTLRRSPRKAQETWVKAHDSAVEQYGEGQRAHRTAMGAVKNSFEKVGDHWEPKARKGPSDEESAKPRQQRRGRTAEGVNAEASKQHLYQVARQLEVPGRSSMSKQELVNAIKKANRRKTAQAR
jgi:cation transport regulator ChaB